VEEKLLGHLLKANDPGTDREIESRLALDPTAARNLAMLRRVIAPLEVDREEVEPPADLWVRTLSRVAEHIVATEGPQTSAETTHTEELLRRAAILANASPIAPRISPAPMPSEALPIAPRRRNLIASFGLAAAVLALALPAIINARRSVQQTACADTMNQFYRAASGYSDTNDGHFPQVEEGKTAGTAAEKLKQFGYLAADKRFTCPAAPEQAGPVALANYAYCLGFRDESGRLQGLDRKPEYNVLPIMADAPIREGRQALPGNHYRGQNVLFADGHVRFCTTSLVGVNMDDIFLNAEGKVGAGLYRDDTALGCWNEVP
jgi:prepilin-type processing-associated H-X9-DG protein